ncbi:DUF4194 domain-containing protein [Microbacterium sp. 22195]|uniref:DUF4194 domain-containing protein n=1 Tax=Microbacterium sp. 22195 TaxID=3453891 RepID=UPI003F85A8AB
MSIIGQVGEVPEDGWDDAEPFEPEDDAESSTVAEFDGDAGGLSPEERRALVVLLKNPFITSESHPREWKAVIASGAAIGQRLNDLYLSLEVNHDREVAYKRPVTSETGSRVFPTLLYNATWQREETALLVYLRVRERNERARGEVRVRVSRSEMLEHLRENRPESATNQASDDKRAGRAIDTIKSTGLLTKTDEDGVYGISPAIEPMMPIPTLNNLLAWLTERMSAEEEMS